MKPNERIKQIEKLIKIKRDYFYKRFEEDNWADDLEKTLVDLIELNAELKGIKETLKYEKSI